MKQIIKNIHDSSLYGNFIEIGAGTPLASQLFEVSGASKTINFSASPYSRFVQLERYGEDFDEKYRSVSLEAVRHIINQEVLLNSNKEVNLFWASSFQLKEEPELCSHGWIGFRFVNNDLNITRQKFYHLTFPNGLDRVRMIKDLGEICVKILFNILQEYKNNSSASENDGKLVLKYVDGVFCDHDLLDNECLKFDYSKFSLDELVHDLDNNGYFVVNPQGSWERLETSFRNHANILLYKGSFNPIHEGHLGIIKKAQEKYPDAPLALMISIKTYQKARVESESLISRIKKLTNECGLYVIIAKEGMYAENIQDLQWRLPVKTKLIFLAGWDTYIRMEDTLFENVDDVEYLIFDRDNKMPKDIERNNCKFITYDCPISSTILREKC